MQGRPGARVQGENSTKKSIAREIGDDKQKARELGCREDEGMELAIMI